MQKQSLESNTFAFRDVNVKWAAQWALYCETGEAASRQISDKVNVDQMVICLFQEVQEHYVL